MTEADKGDPQFVQNVTAVNGFAYGAIGADIHVFGNGLPMYLLANWQPEPPADQERLRELPSRMLNARRAVVPFTGRSDELTQLRQWRDSGPRLAVRWLHGAGGQGKSRLAAQLAAESAESGWKVIAAFHGPDADPIEPGSQDMRLGDASGLLMIVDYADRWFQRNLTWLFKNRLLHQTGVPTRVLMLARTADAWSRVRGMLETYQTAPSSQALPPLTQESSERPEMFTAARDSFAAIYQLHDATGIDPPGPLDEPGFGLTLAVHMAALVAVDARVANKRPPSDVAGLTMYLLDREQLHWARLYDDGAKAAEGDGNTYRTPPTVMNRVVFTAALTGTVTPAVGTALLERLGLSEPEQILRDHAVCYPPAKPSHTAVLEPLYPDRLAEDFLALTMPNHLADYPAQLWAAPTASTLLARDGAQHTPPNWTPRAITFLAAAAERWPHVGTEYLYPLLHDDPRLILDAGGAALNSIANLADAPISLFEAVEPHLPEHRHAELDTGIATLVRRLTAQRLATTDDQVERAGLYATLARRQLNAGLRAEALASASATAETLQSLAESDPDTYEPHLANALADLTSYFLEMGLYQDALDVAAGAVAIWRRQADADPVAAEPKLANALSNLGAALGTGGHQPQALAAAEEALEIRRRLAGADPATYERWLADSLHNVGTGLAKAGQLTRAADAATESLDIYRRLAEENAAMFEPDVGIALSTLSERLATLGQWTRALATAEEALEIQRRLAKANPTAYEPELARSLTKVASRLSDLGRYEEALATEEEAVEIWHRLAASNLVAYDPILALSLHNVAVCLSKLGRREDALTTTEQAVEIWDRLARADPIAFEDRLAHALATYASHLAELGRHQDALATAEKSVEIRRRLAARNPEAHSSELAGSLANLGGYLSRLGRPDLGLALAEESVSLYRTLAEAYSVTYEPELATALTKLGIRYSELRRDGQAASVTEEAVVILRRLAAANPAAFEPQLAKVLRNFSHNLEQAGRRAEVTDVEHETVMLLRRLAAGNRAEYEADLAGALSDLGASLAVSGRGKEAVKLTEEAVEIFRPLAAADPDTYGANLACARRVLTLARVNGAWSALRPYRSKK